MGESGKGKGVRQGKRTRNDKHQHCFPGAGSLGKRNGAWRRTGQRVSRIAYWPRHAHNANGSERRKWAAAVSVGVSDAPE